MSRLYNCHKCPAYCCSYDVITVTDADLRRLAKHFDLTFEQARRRFSTPSEDSDSGRILRHRPDQHYGTACRFLDQDSRQCTVYSARPYVCRSFPGQGRCGYYDFLCFERRTQDDPDWVATTG